ncbi:glycoside hydrolase family 16 protein [Psychromonas algarum]|uniref:glycoside hydrolase family 16 protein n=1 Tax=Psychromonas algarum TaxID=2555643 RepID=UPI001419437F|nr:glycoside hydrolase family 16 protein [Psychromonas sp. RZ22]
MAEEWALVWSDEFTASSTPDRKKWNYEVGYLRNSEKQFYTSADKKNSRVEGGFLIIEAHKRESSWYAFFFDSFTQPEYTSSSLTTKGIISWRYPRIEVRAKLPQGVGVWPAIWLLGLDPYKKGWPAKGEIDLMEYVGFDEKHIHFAVHTKNKNHTLKNGVNHSLLVRNLLNKFHTYAVEVKPERIDFWFDGALKFSYLKESDAYEAWPFDTPMYLIINLAIGGGWGGKKGIDNKIFPQKFVIDYVRVYQKME